MTLSQLTGLPVSILDSNERVDLASIRDYFASRVIGQDEAVSAIVDRIAMLKAGLNDPGKPIGVFLFAGSTGTGKTELAKTVAEYLFGSVDRMVRLDMSEFQTAETAHKILGGEDVEFARQPRAQAALLGGAARRVREGARGHLGPVPAGVRRRPADGRHGPCRRLPPLHDHPHHQPGRHQPSELGARLCACRGRLLQPPRPARDRPDLPPRVPEPARQGDRVPPPDARPDAADPEEGAQPGLAAARSQVPRLGGGMGSLGGGLPAREGLLGGDGGSPAQARDRPVSDRAAGCHHRRAALSRGRPVRVRAQRRAGNPGRVRRSRQRHRDGFHARCSLGGEAAGVAGDDPRPGWLACRGRGARAGVCRCGGDVRFCAVGELEGPPLRGHDGSRFLDRGRTVTPRWRGWR